MLLGDEIDAAQSQVRIMPTMTCGDSRTTRRSRQCPDLQRDLRGSGACAIFQISRSIWNLHSKDEDDELIQLEDM